jgi:hypothetical protein
MDQTEKQESHFNTYEALRRSELIGKGWVPSFIPRSAYDIYEKHRLDVGRVNVKFRFAPGDITPIEGTCARHASEERSVAFYKCKHGNDVVIVKLSEDGRGEIFSE